jgi:sugar O-acyltransferase (sialic acid O-acetyltransferase NeuD family)
MSKPIVIVGAGRQGRIIADALDAGEIGVAGYLDDTRTLGELVHGYPVLNTFAAMRDPAFVADHAWVVALGDNLIRSDLYRALDEMGAVIVNVVHPSSPISRMATLGRGLYIGPLTSIGANSTVGDWAVIEGHARIGGDVRIGEAAFLGPGAILNGGASLGAGCFLGAGTIVSNGVTVGAGCVIGANSTVTRDFPDGTTGYGSPAQPAPLNRRPFHR